MHIPITAATAAAAAADLRREALATMTRLALMVEVVVRPTWVAAVAQARRTVPCVTSTTQGHHPSTPCLARRADVAPALSLVVAAALAVAVAPWRVDRPRV